MLDLRSIPAFGFEYDKCCAGFARLRHKNHAEMSNGQINNYITISIWATNFFKLLGVVCPLVGAVRMIDALCSDDENKAMHFLRGLGELLGCGIFILGVDIVVTIHRAGYVPKHGVAVM